MSAATKEFFRNEIAGRDGEPDLPVPRRPRAKQLDELDQIAAATVVGDVVYFPSKRIEGLVYCVSAEGCQCPGFASHKHCYHEERRRLVLWLSQWLDLEGLTLLSAVDNLRKSKKRGGCGETNCSFCRRFLHCPRTAVAADWQFVQAAA